MTFIEQITELINQVTLWPIQLRHSETSWQAIPEDWEKWEAFVNLVDENLKISKWDWTSFEVWAFKWEIKMFMWEVIPTGWEEIQIQWETPQVITWWSYNSMAYNSWNIGWTTNIKYIIKK